MAFVVHVLLPIRQKARGAEVLSPPVCASLCLWNRGRRPVEILVWQTAAFCLANRRLLPGILRPRVPSRLVLGLTYSQLFTFHRVLWRCAATSGARGRHASVLMLCVSGKNIKAGVLRRKKLLKKQLSKRTFIYLCSVKSVSPEETDEARPRCGAGPVCQRGAGTFFHHSHARSPHCRKLRLLFFRPPRDAPAPVPASAGTGAACAGSAARSLPVLSSLEHIEAIGELQHDITVHLLTPRVAAP